VNASPMLPTAIIADACNFHPLYICSFFPPLSKIMSLNFGKDRLPRCCKALMGSPLSLKRTNDLIRSLVPRSSSESTVALAPPYVAQKGLGICSNGALHFEKCSSNGELIADILYLGASG
jgi:hypothetical protein